MGMLQTLAGTPAPAQSTAPPSAAVATPAVAPPAAAAPAAKPAAKPRECTRLPLSDIQVGKDKTIEVARLRLDEYMAKVGKQRGWKTWDKSLETTACEDYLFVPLLGQEYKCLVTATFCKKS
jgi:zona occludens toxin (predicted ATPase)